MSRRPQLRRRLLPGDGPLARVPPLAAFLVVLAVFGLAVWAGGTLGAALLGALAAFVAVLLSATWHRLSPPDRVARLVTLAVLIAVAVAVASAPPG